MTRPNGSLRPNISYTTHPKTPFGLFLMNLINQSRSWDEADGNM